MIDKLQKFIIALLNPSGIVSFGRFMTIIVTSFVLGWDTANLVFAWRWNHLFPLNRIPLLPDAITLGAQVAFMTAFYGITKYQEYKTGAAGASTASPGSGAPAS